MTNVTWWTESREAGRRKTKIAAWRERSSGTAGPYRHSAATRCARRPRASHGRVTAAAENRRTRGACRHASLRRSNFSGVDPRHRWCWGLRRAEPHSAVPAAAAAPTASAQSTSAPFSRFPSSPIDLPHGDMAGAARPGATLVLSPKPPSFTATRVATLHRIWSK